MSNPIKAFDAEVGAGQAQCCAASLSHASTSSPPCSLRRSSRRSSRRPPAQLASVLKTKPPISQKKIASLLQLAFQNIKVGCVAVSG